MTVDKQIDVLLQTFAEYDPSTVQAAIERWLGQHPSDYQMPTDEWASTWPQ